MDQALPSTFELFKSFAEALAIGLLIGIERYKARSPGEKGPAGVRTFAVIAVLGAVCGLLQQPVLTGLVFLALAALLAISYFRSSQQSLGITTETAALLAFWLGFLVHTREVLALGIAIVLAVLLAAKEPLHAFARKTISELEFYDTLKFLVVVFVVYPLLPDRNLGPFELFNPAKIWSLIILVSSISYLGYLAIRLLGARRGLHFSALLGGVASTVAVTMSLADRARAAPESSQFFGVTAVLANAAQFPRLLLLAGVTSWALTQELLPVLGVMLGAALLGAWLFSRGFRKTDRDSVQLVLSNPYSFVPALKFGLFFVAILTFSKLATNWFGSQGILAASLLGGLASVSAVVLSIANLLESGAVSSSEAALGVLVGVLANAASKMALARLHGTAGFARWLGAGLGIVLLTGFGTALLLDWLGG